MAEFNNIAPGTTAKGEKIQAFASRERESRFVYLMAGVHGDEVEGIFLLEKLFSWLKETATSLSLPLMVIPVLNKDGLMAGTRANGHGVDLNRNLPSPGWSPKARSGLYRPGLKPLSEPENIFLDGLFQTYRPGIIFSFHSWKPMLNYNGDCEDVALFLHGHNSYPVCKDTEGHPTPGSLGEYAPHQYQCPVLTHESPVLDRAEGDFSAVWEENGEGLQKLLEDGLLGRFLSP